MRRLIAALLFFSFVTFDAKAGVFQLVHQGMNVVYGNFGPDGSVIFGAVSLQLTGGYLPIYDYENSASFASYEAFVSGPGTLVSQNGCNLFEAHCGRANQDRNSVPIFGLNNEGAFFVNWGVTLIGTGATPPTISVFLDLPDGFTLVAPIPEPSTWAMLLIGFAGIGYLTCRRRYQMLRIA